MNRPNLQLFDTASLYFRAFFGLPGSLRAQDGQSVNAVRGLLDFMAKIVADKHGRSITRLTQSIATSVFLPVGALGFK
mgnify:CR=1 FL=1